MVACGGGPDVDHLSRARELRDAGDLQAATLEIEAAIRSEPANAELRRMQGLIQLDANNAAAAEIALGKAIELGAADDETRLGFARALFRQDKHRALKDFLDVIRFQSNRAEADAYVLKGMSLDRLQETAAARRTFLQLFQKLDRRWFGHDDPLDAEALMHSLSERRGDYPALAEALDYRDLLVNPPAGEWVTLHKQNSRDAVYFFRQDHGGSAFDSKRGRLVLFGSNTHTHWDLTGENWHNSLFFFDPAVAEWTLSYPMDPVSTYTVSAEGVPVAGERGDRPWAMHTYGAVSYDAQRDELVVSSYPAHLEPGLFTYTLEKVWPLIRHHPTWTYDFPSGRWHALPGPLESFFQFATAYDSDRGIVIGYKDSGIFELTGSPRTWHKVAEGGLLGEDNNVEYDPKHKALIVFGSKEKTNDVVAYETATGRHRKMPTRGPRPPGARYVPMAFYPRIGKTVVLVEREPKDRNADVYTETWLYDLGEDVWQQVESATLKLEMGRNYNLEYDSVHDLLLFLPNPYGIKGPTTVLALRL